MKAAVCLAIFAWVGISGCSTGTTSAEIPAPSPGLELSTERYSTARARFRTHLIREGPATPDRIKLPEIADAVEVAYPSGNHSLRAYASPPEPAGRAKPGLLFLHGGFVFGEGHWAMTRPFREAGYVVMMPTLRGENGQPGNFSLFYDEVADVLAASDSLAARPDVDSKHLYLAGHSVGGTLAMLTALESSRFRGAASFSGSPDQREYTRGRPERVPFDPTNGDEFRLRSPVVFATGFRCPLRLYFGEEEYWLLNATRRTALLADRAGLDVEAVEVAGGHETANPEVIQKCIEFFRSL
ncbi:alpha/beta hydrolase family protein [Tundrisphaera lichenicola]|uniref:alpha/beta hydrolase family protein n=1 Tax=Tundrisphaera lichenicola TaxID=2029860 RepID=UPI003EB880D9